MRTALVFGAGDFTGGYLVKRLKSEGIWMRGVEVKSHEYRESTADDCVVADLRDRYLSREMVDRR